jgi:hypothetical protein
MMAEPDCELCGLLGYRSCDDCGGVVFNRKRDAFGRELCAYCN